MALSHKRDDVSSKYCIAQTLGRGILVNVSSETLLASKTFGKFPLVSFLYICHDQDIVKIWMVNFGEPPVICQIHQGFPLSKTHMLYGNQSSKKTDFTVGLP